MDQEERQAAHDEIAELALMQLEPPAASFNSLASMPGTLGRAEEIFVNVFAAQALDQIESLLANSKEVIAEEVADATRKAIDIGVSMIESVKARYGIGTPSVRPSSSGPLMPN